MAGFREVVFAVALAACSSSPEPQARAEAPVPAPLVTARIVSIEGDVRVRVERSARWTSASVGQTLGAEDAIQAMPGARTTVRFERTGAEMVLESGTTLRVPRPTTESARAQPLRGHFIARAGGSRGTASLEVELPPGTLVLDPGESRRELEAAIDVGTEGSSIEMVHGDAELVRPRGEHVALRERGTARFDAQGEPAIEHAVAIAILEPAQGAQVRTRDAVTLRWSPIAGAPGYVVHIDDRDVASAEPSLTVALTAGEHRVAVRASGGAPHASEPVTFVVDVDRTPPRLVLTSPAAGAIATGPVVAVAGRTEPGVTIECADRRAIADARGRFTLDAPVGRGATNLVVRAIDDLGNAELVSRTVIRD